MFEIISYSNYTMIKMHSVHITEMFSFAIGTPSPCGSGLKKHQQPTPRGSCMTTVEEELEQSTEDIANAIETTPKNPNGPDCTGDTHLAMQALLDRSSLKLPVSNTKERLGHEEEDKCSQSSVDNSSHEQRAKPFKSTNNHENQALTMSSSSNLSLNAGKHSSAANSSNILISNPSLSPTAHAITSLQVASSRTSAITECAQVCISFYYFNNSTLFL